MLLRVVAVPRLPEIGDVLSGKYRVVRVIGEGGMGVVYEGLHTRIEQRVAIKVLHPRMLKTGEFVQRFEREARASGRLKSRYTTRVLDVAETDDGLPYMVMELLIGHDLETELAQRGRLPFPEAVEYLMQICAAMAEAHDLGIVHRDLKPANLMLCQSEEGERFVRVLDFGISKVLDGESSMTKTSTALGTPLYMSPEQVRSPRSVDARADIWSLGVIAYEMLAGRRPFEGENATATIAAIVTDEPPPLQGLCSDLPQELTTAIHKALEKPLANRFVDVRAFAAAIAPFGTSGSMSKIPRPPVERIGSRPPASDVPDRAQLALAPTQAVIAPGPETRPTPDGTHAADAGAASRKLRVVVSFLGLQTGWFACVLGATHGHPYVGPLVVMATLAAHVQAQPPKGRAAEALVLGLVAAAGFGVDTALLRLGIITVQGALVSPSWLVALWPNFAAATAANGSLASLARRPLLGALLGALAGPFVYDSGRALGAIGLSQDHTRALVIIGVVWATVLPLLFKLRSLTTDAARSDPQPA
jgi:serine/threonine-protein kinase